MLLADTSTWHHSTNPGVAEHWGHLLDSDQVATCGPVRLEVLYSARSEADYDAISFELDGLHQLPCGQTAIDRALYDADYDRISAITGQATQWAAPRGSL